MTPLLVAGVGVLLAATISSPNATRITVLVLLGILAGEFVPQLARHFRAAREMSPVGNRRLNLEPEDYRAGRLPFGSRRI